MSFLFGGARPSGSESLKDYQRRVAASARGMEREIARAEGREACIQRELAKLAKDGRLEPATSKATELVRLRAHKGRLYTMKGHMQGLAQQLQSAQTSNKMQETMASAARILRAVNTRFDAAAIQRMLADYERQNVLMANKQELVEDTLDSTLEVDGEHEATSDAVTAVLQEAGLDVSSRLGATGDARGQEPSVEELDGRLQRLRSDRVG
jgi:charged multivesicular body protein 2A